LGIAHGDADLPDPAQALLDETQMTVVKRLITSDE
jgi:hypothetical protein